MKASLGEACRRMGFPVMEGTGDEMVAAATAATSAAAVKDVTKKVWKGGESREVFNVKKVSDMMLFNYDGAVAPHFDYRTGGGATAMEGVTAAMWRRECRGLVMGGEGVIARPMHKFFEQDQVTDSS